MTTSEKKQEMILALHKKCNPPIAPQKLFAIKYLRDLFPGSTLTLRVNAYIAAYPADLAKLNYLISK